MRRQLEEATARYAKTIEQLANAMELSSRMVATYMTKGLREACLTDHGYDVEAAKEWRTKHVGGPGEYDRNGDAPEGPKAAKLSADARKAHADAEVKELKVKQLRRELLPRVEVEQFIAECFIRVKTRVEEIPDRLEAEMPAEVKTAVRAIAETVVHTLLTEMSNMMMEE